MTEAEKRRRFQRDLGWIYIPVGASLWLALSALRLRDGEITKAEFLWRASMLVLVIVVGALIPWAEERRLRRLAEERRKTRRPPLSLSA